jgi:hypothetical protein
MMGRGWYSTGYTLVPCIQGTVDLFFFKPHIALTKKLEGWRVMVLTDMAAVFSAKYGATNSPAADLNQGTVAQPR